MNENKPILFFDGHCNLCNGFIDFLVSHDPEHKILIASLQGKTAKERLPEEDRVNLKSVVLLDLSGSLHHKSSAIFQVAKELGGWFNLIRPFWILPRPFTNWVYDFIAINRYRWFGRKETCRIPTAEERAHFLD